MTRCFSLLTLTTALAVAGFTTTLSAAEKELQPTKKLKALLVTGGCCHDYKNQANILMQGISQRAAVEWTVYLEGTGTDLKNSAYAKDDWYKGYDVVVHNECYADTKDVEFVERIAKAHHDGLASVVIHCTMHTYRSAKTDEWRKMLGVTSNRHERGGRRLDVKRMDATHPVMQGFPETWKTPNGELYVIEKLWPNCQPLATAYGQDTKKDQPCMWANTYGKGRTFGTTIGHHNETMKDPVYLDTLTRGLLWACGKLGDDGKPLPGYEGTGVKDLDLAAKPKEDPSKQPTPASWAEGVKFPKGEKPVHLFNGKDLTGWHGRKDLFSVKDGAIVARNGKDDAPKASTYLLSDKKYRNFRLVFEGKLVESGMHSGVALWGKPVEKEGDPNSYQGHLVMFPAGWGIYDLYRRNSIYQDDGRARKADNKGWNQMEILAIGDRIRLAVNGQEVADWTDPKPELCGEGPLGLQLHANKVPQEVHFRGLILAENPEDRLITVEKK